MTNTELKTFRKILEARQTDLAIGNREALAVEASPDEMDRVQHFSEREYAMNHLERNSNRLREVRAALSRMKAGTYGVCVECDKPINLKRIQAVPWTSTCIVCQQAAENARTDSAEASETSEEIAA
jgi:DnaK suppressor protein